MQHVAHRGSDPVRPSNPTHCNKCGDPLDPDGICRQPHATQHLPPMQEQRATTMIGRTHLGSMAKPVAA